MKRSTSGFLLFMLGLGIIIYANFTYNPCFCPVGTTCICDVEQGNLLHTIGLIGGFILAGSGLVVSLLGGLLSRKANKTPTANSELNAPTSYPEPGGETDNTAAPEKEPL